MLCSTSQDQQQENSSLGGDSGFRHRERREKGESERKQGQGRGWLPKQIGCINLSLASSMVCVHVLSVCSYYKATRGEQYAKSHFNTIVRHSYQTVFFFVHGPFTLKFCTTEGIEERKKGKGIEKEKCKGFQCILITSCPLGVSKICNMIRQTSS